MPFSCFLLQNASCNFLVELSAGSHDQPSKTAQQYLDSVFMHLVTCCNIEKHDMLLVCSQDKWPWAVNLIESSYRKGPTTLGVQNIQKFLDLGGPNYTECCRTIRCHSTSFNPFNPVIFRKR